MNDPVRPIFRLEAVQRYAQSKEKIVLPRLLSPALFIYLWVLVGLLLASSIGAWFLVASHI